MCKLNLCIYFFDSNNLIILFESKKVLTLRNYIKYIPYIIVTKMQNKQNTTTYTLFLDSRNANYKKNNLDFSFILNSIDTFPGLTYTSVKSVELTALSFINGSGNSLFYICLDSYFIIDIEELNNRLHSNVASAHNAFAIIHINGTNDNDGRRIEKIKGQDFDTKIKVFDPPLVNLSRLSVKIKSPNEELYPINPNYGGYMLFTLNIIIAN